MSSSRFSVAVSGRFLRISQPTGTQRSSEALLLATIRAGFNNVLVFCPRNKSAHRDFTKTHKVPFCNSFFDHFWEQLVFPLFIKSRVLWTLMGTGPIVHPRKRHVMVVHDLNFEILPHVYGNSFRHWYRFACGVAAQKADIVVCFTNYVSATLQDRLGIPIDRIKVIPQGPGLFGLDKPLEILRSEAPERPYFLCVGNLQPHKNLAGVLAAWDMFRRQHSCYSLKVVGRAQGNFVPLGVDLSRLPPDVEFTGYLSDEVLISLYQGATGFIYPSVEEGFGLPVVEAFYCGCPVITSNRSCLPEVAGNAALLVNPHNTEAIANAMAVLALDSGKAEELRAKGFERAAFFSWDNAGCQMARILEEACS